MIRIPIEKSADHPKTTNAGWNLNRSVLKYTGTAN